MPTFKPAAAVKSDEFCLMTHSRSRRRVLAAAVPTLLGGCLVESRADPAARSDASSARTDADGNDGEGDGTDGESDGTDGESDGSDGGSNGGGDTADAAPAGSTSPAGIAVESVSIDRIVGSIHHLSQIAADVTVRNAGPATYGSVELRVDAFYNPPADDRTYHPPRVDERTAVGRRYVDREFDGFESGTRTFEVVVRYDADADANGSTDPDAFDLTVAIRGADAI